MIDIAELTTEDVGKWVVCDSGFKKEKGRVKSWNDKWVFVVYKCNHGWDNFQEYTGCATNPDQLNFTSKGEMI